MKLSEIPFYKINLNDDLISAMGSTGKIVDQDLIVKGAYLELYLYIEWNSGATSRVLFPDECTNITLTKEPYVHQG